MVHAGRLHLNAVPRLCGRDVVALVDLGGVEEVLVEVVHELEKRPFASDADVVDCGEMLGVFGETDTAGVGDDRDVEPGLFG